MDPYLLCLIIGGSGLALMAVTGLSHHVGGGGHGHGGHGGHGHGGHGHAAPGHGHAAGHGHAHGHGTDPSGGGFGMHATTWMLMSPRFLFAGLLGFGLVGLAFRSLIGGIVLLAVAIAGGILVERLLVAPLWKQAMRFETRPATTLESATFSEAQVVSNFDKNGQGIVALEVDGQVQQVLATLSAADLAKGARVRAGQLVRVDEVDGARHRCTVSVL